MATNSREFILYSVCQEKKHDTNKKMTKTNLTATWPQVSGSTLVASQNIATNKNLNGSAADISKR